MLGFTVSLHHALPEREKHDEREDAQCREQTEIEYERRRRREMREDASDGSDDQKLAAAKTVDQEKTGERTEPKHNAERSRRTQQST